MKRYSIWRDPDFWSQVALLLMPFFGFAALLLLTKPDTPQGNQAAGRRVRDNRVMPRIVIPESLPPEVLPKLSAISPHSLADVVERMALDTEQTVAEIKPDVTTEYAPRPAIAVEQKGLPVPQFRVRTFVTGLASPDGIAIDPRTGNIFVSEEEAHRIAMITPRGRIRTVIDSNTRLYVMDGRAEKRIPPLRSPEGLAMDRFGRLYVVEDREKGRILSIQISENGKVGPSEIINVPGKATGFRWEGVAVRDTGELILTGSTAEDALNMGGMIQGTLVYRDGDNRWWVPIMRPMAGLADVNFSKGGQFAVYTDEITGTLGWIDLQSRFLREGASQRSFKSPEGVCVLPDGRLVVAEEGGRISIVDPEVDAVTVIAEGLGSIESLTWDDRGNRLLVTADGAGSLLELVPDAALAAGIDRMRRAVCHSEGAIRHVPASAPEFLRPLLEMGGLSEFNSDFDLAFDELTRRVPILATDARAILLQGSDEVPDPVVHLRFVALDPNRMRFDEPGFDFALSAMILRTRSGQIYKTKLARTIVMSGNLWSGEIKNHGAFDIPVPFAYQAQPGPRGHAVIHFTGLGRSPDISIALNPSNPDESFMLITHINGLLEQYRLVQTRAADGSENWVISMPARRQIPWLKIADPITDARPQKAL
jgi:DNA-binding beta-propeller fold protein YncE